MIMKVMNMIMKNNDNIINECVMMIMTKSNGNDNNVMWSNGKWKWKCVNNEMA